MILLPAIVVYFSNSLYAQDKKEKLKKRKKEIEEDIRYTNNLIDETTESKKNSLKKLLLIKRQIESRSQLVRTINSEVDYLKEQISSNQEQINQLNEELETLKDEYAKMIYHAYKTKSKYHKLMFIFSAEDFDQAYRRLKYLRQYSDFRKKQAREIQGKKKTLNNKIAKLKEDKERKVELMARKQQEKEKLKSEKENKNEIVSNLKQKEHKLRERLSRKQEKARELEEKIEKIIAREMAESEEAKEEEASPKFKMTPEQVELSENFTKNKGKLPWPTKKGIVSSTFGQHTHETLDGVVLYNNGITIQTSKNAWALAVFEGNVNKVISIGNKKAVLIRHGDYFTLYDNLRRVNVKPGDQVKTGQKLGIIKNDNNTGYTQINFQIWKVRKQSKPKKLNPSEWLLSR